LEIQTFLKKYLEPKYYFKRGNWFFFVGQAFPTTFYHIYPNTYRNKEAIVFGNNFKIASQAPRLMLVISASWETEIVMRRIADQPRQKVS
jgi:hypothetical protein